MPKAIFITKENRVNLETQYDLEIDQLKGMEGLALVADFGGRTVHGYLNKVAFEKNFVATGQMLDNDYFEVRDVRK